MLFVACSQPQTPEIHTPQKGSITFAVQSTPAVSLAFTRADLGDGDIYKGGGIEDFLFVLVDPNNNVVVKRTFSHSSTSFEGEKYSNSKEHIFSVPDLDVGDYTAYVYANINRSLYTSVADVVADIVVGQPFTHSLDRFATLSGSDTPDVNTSNPLFLSAEKVVSVGVGNVSAVIELSRPVVWFEMMIYNNTGYPLTVEDVVFNNFNPATSTVLPKADILAQSTQNQYRALPAYPYRHIGLGASESKSVINPHSSGSVYQCFLFENTGASSLYQFDIDLSLAAGTTTTQTVYNGTTIHTSTFTVGADYMLKNGEYFLYDDEGTLRFMHEDDINQSNYALASWEFSGSNSGYLINEATKHRFYRGYTNASNLGSNWNFVHQGNGSYYIRRNTSLYLRRNGTNAVYDGTNANRLWQLYTVNFKIENVTTTLEKSLQNQQINVIQSDGTATPMTCMRRNQKITLATNVYYEETTGVFRFYVEPWKEVNLEHVFE